MKRTIRTISILLLILIAAASCRNQTIPNYEYKEPTTWAELFDIFWMKMNTNYLFWNLEYEKGLDWDDVYTEYHDDFEKLGAITDNSSRSEDEQKLNTHAAYKLFFDIVKDLSDGHYTLAMTDEKENNISISPYTVRVMRSLGISDERIFELRAMTLEDRQKTDEYKNKIMHHESNAETTLNIARNSFGISEVEVSDSANIKTVEASKYNFESMQFLNYRLDPTSTFVVLYGRSSDGIVYLGFNGFSFSDIGSIEAPSDILQDFYPMLENAKGVIIDLRGNGGGSVSDIPTLWSSFITEDTGTVHFADTRRKSGDNRMDYGPWAAFELFPRSQYTGDFYLDIPPVSFDKDIPIAILHNSGSVSCAEFSVMFFRALRQFYGYNVKTFGSTTAGGNGMLLNEDTHTESEILFNAGITDIKPYVTLLYTPYCQMRYVDGTIYEGVGIPPDKLSDFVYEDFEAGTDARLQAAIDWITEQGS